MRTWRRGATAAIAIAAAFFSACASGRHRAPPGGATEAKPAAADATERPPSQTSAAQDAASGAVLGADRAASAPFAQVGDRAFDGDDVAREFFRAFRREAFASLNRMVVRELVRQEALRSGMAPPESWLAAEREAAFRAMAADAVAAYGKDADMETFLRVEMKETKAEWSRRTEVDLRDRWLRDRVVRLQGLRQEQAEIQLLTVRDESLARELASKLDQGADFAALALAHSVHETAGAGGRMPFVSRESLNPALGDRAFTLPVGARSGVLSVEDAAGERQFNLLKVLARRPARAHAWADVAVEIEAGLGRDPVSRLEFVAWQLAAFRLYNVVVDDSL